MRKDLSLSRNGGHTMKLVFKTAIAAIAMASATPSFATLVNPATCSPSTATSVADGIQATACVGYYSSNLLNDSPTDLQNQTDALTDLLGAPTVITQSLFNTLTGTTSLNGGILDFGPLIGTVVIGVHMGNVTGDDINDRSVFYLFNFGTTQTGINLGLTDTQKFSNAILYQSTQPVPEPAAWGMMVLGFAGIGFAIRRRRKAALPQVA